jgi:hypothetical protein
MAKSRIPLPKQVEKVIKDPTQYDRRIGKRVSLECSCGNPEMGFNCVCDWVEKNPGDIAYSCEFCGIYTAGKPRCNHCEED